MTAADGGERGERWSEMLLVLKRWRGEKNAFVHTVLGSRAKEAVNLRCRCFSLLLGGAVFESRLIGLNLLWLIIALPATRTWSALYVRKMK